MQIVFNILSVVGVFLGGGVASWVAWRSRADVGWHISHPHQRPDEIRNSDATSVPYTVTNVGTAPAYDVHLILRPHNGQEFMRILRAVQAGDSVTIDVDRMIAADIASGEVQWRPRTDGGGKRRRIAELSTFNQGPTVLRKPGTKRIEVPRTPT